MLRISTARRLADILWPAFVEQNDMIFLPNTSASMWTVPAGSMRTEHERLQGHSHIQDLFRWDVPTLYDPDLAADKPDPDTPEHAAAWELAQRIGEMWFAKLTGVGQRSDMHAGWPLGEKAACICTRASGSIELVEQSEFDEAAHAERFEAFRARYEPPKERFYGLVDAELYPRVAAYVRAHPE